MAIAQAAGAGAFRCRNRCNTGATPETDAVKPAILISRVAKLLATAQAAGAGAFRCRNRCKTGATPETDAVKPAILLVKSC